MAISRNFGKFLKMRVQVEGGVPEEGGLTD